MANGQIGRAQIGRAQLGSTSSGAAAASFFISPNAGHTAGARTISVIYSGAVTSAGNPFTISSGPGSISAYVQDTSTTCHFTYTQVGVSSTPTVFADSVTSTTQSYSNAAVVPTAPTIGTLTDNLDGTITVTFTAPADNGGAAVTTYTATDSVGGVNVSGASSPLTLTGVTVLVAQTVSVTATNSVGAGPASAASNSVTPFANAVTQSQVAPFVASDVLGTVAAQAYKYSGGAMVAAGAAPTINTISNIANGRQALFSVPPVTSKRFNGVARWCPDTAAGMPQYFSQALNIFDGQHNFSLDTTTVTAVCNLPSGTDITGTIGYQLISGANANIGALVTTGIYTVPLVAGPDKFCTELTLAPGSYSIRWQNGAGVYSVEDVVIPGVARPTTTKTVTFIVKTALGVVQANLTGIRWKWSDVRGIVIDTGTGATTDGAGVFLITVHSALATGVNGYLDWDNSTTGVIDTTYVAFGGPVAVS